jgi:DNA-binding beta-propeller fold protein YncE
MAVPVATPPVGRLVRLPSGSAPEGVAVDHSTHSVVVALHKPDRVALVDERTLDVRTRAVPGSARHLVLAAPGGPVLLPGEDTNRLLQLSATSGRVLHSTTLPKQPHNATIVGSHIWVDDELAGELSVLDSDGTVVATLKGPVQPGGVAAAAGVVGAVDVRGARLYFYDANSYRAEGSIPMGSGPTHAEFVGGDDIVVADTRGGALLLVDLATRRIVSRLSLPGGPYGLASDPSTGDIWTTLTQFNKVVHVKVESGALREISSTPTVEQANTVGVDLTTRCLYVAGLTASVLQVICPGDPGSGS